jgi:hypothetical protein
VDHLSRLALLRGSDRETSIHSESAVALIKSWGKHLIELALLYVSAKINSSTLVMLAVRITIAGEARIHRLSSKRAPNLAAGLNGVTEITQTGGSRVTSEAIDFDIAGITKGPCRY